MGQGSKSQVHALPILHTDDRDDVCDHVHDVQDGSGTQDLVVNADSSREGIRLRMVADD